MAISNLLRQVAPLRIHAADQVIFLLSWPAFDLLLSDNGALGIIAYLIIHELGGVVPFRESFDYLLFVFVNSSLQVIGDSCIKHGVAFIGHHVYVVLPLHLTHDHCKTSAEQSDHSELS